MGLFLSREDQQITESIFSIGLCFMPKDSNLDIITAIYKKNSVVYYLFNKLKIWES